MTRWLKDAPTLAELAAIFRRDYPFFRGLVERNADAFGPTWSREFEELLVRLFGEREALARAAKGYALFVMDLMRRQRRFERDRTYPVKAYGDTVSEVYLDEQYMLSEYLPGLILSHFLWPHHCWHSRFFDSAFVSQMQLRGASQFVEVGVGTGLYSRKVLQSVTTASGTGVDISPASLMFAERHIKAFDLENRYATEIRDIVAEPLAPVEWLICVEVLEHLDDPLSFLRVLRDAVAPGGRAFITAALNAAHVDHIYLYETYDAVGDHLQTAGFALEQAFVGTAYPPPKPGVPVPTVAAFVVG